jgi:hypothetical protein
MTDSAIADQQMHSAEEFSSGLAAEKTAQPSLQPPFFQFICLDVYSKRYQALPAMGPHWHSRNKSA